MRKLTALFQQKHLFDRDFIAGYYSGEIDSGGGLVGVPDCLMMPRRIRLVDKTHYSLAENIIYIDFYVGWLGQIECNCGGGVKRIWVIRIQGKAGGQPGACGRFLAKISVENK